MAFGTIVAASLAILPAGTGASAVNTPAAATKPVTEAITPLPTPVQTETELVEAEADRYKRMTVPVTIEGEGPFYFMIDTGAQATVVTRGLTEKLELLPIGSATIVGMGSRRAAQLFQLDGLEFAQRVLDNIEAPMLEARNIGADGILGLDSLQDLRVLIDFRNDTIAVNDAELLGGNSGYEIVVRARHRLGRLIITSADIDGVKTAVILDTGAQSSFGNSKLRQRLRARKRQEVSSTDVNGVTIVGNLHSVRSLKIQELTIENLAVTFAESPAFAALGLGDRPALILGMRDLRLFDRVAIDFATRRVLFDVPRGRAGRRRVKERFGPDGLPGA